MKSPETITFYVGSIELDDNFECFIIKKTIVQMKKHRANQRIQKELSAI